MNYCYPPSVILQAFNVLRLQSILPIVARITFSKYQSHHFLIKDQKDFPVLLRRVQHLKIQDLSNLLLTSFQVTQNLFRACIRDRVTIPRQVVPLPYCRFLLYIYLFGFHFILPGFTVTIFKLPNLSSLIQVQYNGAISIQ